MKRIKNKKFRDIIIIVFCLFASFQILTSVLNPYIKVKTENSELTKNIENLQSKNDELKKSLEQSENSREMEESYMRERFHMSKKGELIFVFPDA